MATSCPITSQANVFPYTGCANCQVFGWVQPDPAQLRNCGKCKVLKYCSQECQAEHWKLVHKGQCKLLAKARESSKIPVTIFSHHPFPSFAPPENTLEALVELIQRVLAKMQDINHPVCYLLPAQMKQIEDTVVRYRDVIWAHQKTFPKQAKIPWGLESPLAIIDFLDYQSQSKTDPLDLGSILSLLWFRLLSQKTVLELNLMKDPGAMILKKAWEGAEKEVGDFPNQLQELIKAFYASERNFPSYEGLLKAFCGGSLIQKCSFCSNTIKVDALLRERSSSSLAFAMIQPHFSPTFSCGKPACIQEMVKKARAWNDWQLAEAALFKKLQITRCDFCFKHAGKVNRCSGCLTKNWCSKECPFKDLQKRHEEFCQKDSDGRKIKGDAEVRKEVGTEELEKCFNNGLKTAASLGHHGAEHYIERVQKLYKSEEKSKVMKKSKSKKTMVKE